MRILPTLVLVIFLAGCAGSQSKPASWTPELIAATQSSFKLPGDWRFTARSGADFGSRCDIRFESDGTYRKSCRPPAEESGEWKQVGEWDGHTMKVQLSDRVDLIAKRPIDDAVVLVVVESTAGDEITFDGAPYQRN